MARRGATIADMHPADFYTGIVAEVYAMVRGTHFGADRYRSFIEEHGAPALELGCGADGPFYELAESGLDLEGVDSSMDMVRRGRERLSAQGIRAPVHHQRMEDLALDRSFASIYLAGPTFNLLPDDVTALQALRAIAAHLRPDGAALVPLWTPPPTPAEQIGVVRSARTAEVETRYTVISEVHDADTRTRTSTTRYELDSGNEPIVEEREWIIHWHDREGFRQLALQAGLEVAYTQIDDEQVEALLETRPGAR